MTQTGGMNVRVCQRLPKFYTAAASTFLRKSGCLQVCSVTADKMIRPVQLHKRWRPITAPPHFICRHEPLGSSLTPHVIALFKEAIHERRRFVAISRDMKASSSTRPYPATGDHDAPSAFQVRGGWHPGAICSAGARRSVPSRGRKTTKNTPCWTYRRRKRSSSAHFHPEQRSAC